MTDTPADRTAAMTRLLTITDVADLTGMSVAFWRKQIAAKRIPFTSFGRSVRISPADLNAFIAKRRSAER